MVIAYKTIHKL